MRELLLVLSLAQTHFSRVAARQPGHLNTSTLVECSLSPLTPSVPWRPKNKAGSRSNQIPLIRAFSSFVGVLISETGCYVDWRE